jgi:hypothetical protein
MSIRPATCSPHVEAVDLRTHIGTRDGRKGSAPLGRDYLLENWEASKNLYSNGLVKVQPGRSFDTGAHLKVRVLELVWFSVTAKICETATTPSAWRSFSGLRPANDGIANIEFIVDTQ